ncbi:hypothetical protein KFE25_008019 [Diacronema lutheri]|uniref:NAD(P)-binding domain-containing protein n=1 Tax=Diacronema lutheri TaxID=2081491 RepID=A0A8J6CE78_DIALT|nr:hypothetical protein KFE25_008019 [Diacronema lutheri]
MVNSLRILAILLVAAGASARETTLVTGATGKTGALVYNSLRSRHADVRALVRNRDKARDLLHCTRCDESEGIHIADVTQPEAEAFGAAFRGVSTVVILSASYPVKMPNGTYTYPPGGFPVDVDYHGGVNIVRTSCKAGVARVILVSSMGTTQPDSFLDRLGNGHALFFKTQAELAVMSASPHLNYTIVKPSGLVDEVGGQSELLVGRRDELARTGKMRVPRADVAAVVVAAVELRERSGGLWFDLSSDADGKPTADFGALFDRVREVV